MDHPVLPPPVHIIYTNFHRSFRLSSNDRKHSDDKSEQWQDWSSRKVKEFLEILVDHQNVVVSLSLGSFLFYFLYYREESDVDKGMKIPIWAKVDGIDPKMAERMIECDRKFGLDVKESEKLLQEYTSHYYSKEK